MTPGNQDASLIELENSDKVAGGPLAMASVVPASAPIRELLGQKRWPKKPGHVGLRGTKRKRAKNLFAIARSGLGVVLLNKWKDAFSNGR